MRRYGSLTYGIRLDGLMVVDLDTDNDATRAYCERRFDPSPLVVTTGRGEHRYYRYTGPSISPVRERGVAIDFKSGKSAFVVGPGSLRPDGKSYRIASGDFTVPAPWFVQRVAQPETGNPVTGAGKPVAVGSRHPALVKKAVEYCHCVDTFDELMADLMALRDLHFEDAGSVSDDEVVDVARWAWRKRAEGNLYAGRNSVVKFNRMAWDAISARDDGEAAWMLYTLLLTEHGHMPGKVFAIVPDGIIKAGRLKISRPMLYRARDVLLDECLIVRVARGHFTGTGRVPDRFRLLSPLVATEAKRNKERKGGSLPIILVPVERHGSGVAA
jgi:hypothetical protein